MSSGTSRAMSPLSCTAASCPVASAGAAGPKRWIMVKVRDEGARPGSDIVAEEPASVRSGKTWMQLREQ